MTFPAWLAVILAIVLCVLNANREKLGVVLKERLCQGANAEWDKSGDIADYKLLSMGRTSIVYVTYDRDMQ